MTEISGTEPTSVRIKFTLGERCGDEVSYRHLYHAHLEDGQAVYVKFTPKHSRRLHTFCASRNLAPRLLGFEKLTGGWYAVVMEKVDTAGIFKAGSLFEPEKWKEEIWSLLVVQGFHAEGLVHGDLRLANFIFTKSTNPRRMMVVDFPPWSSHQGVGRG